MHYAVNCSVLSVHHMTVFMLLSIGLEFLQHALFSLVYFYIPSLLSIKTISLVKARPHNVLHSSCYNSVFTIVNSIIV